jgi:hypothetical protein
MPSTSAASCDALNRITPSLIGGQRKAPRSSRFQNSARPDPSQGQDLQAARPLRPEDEDRPRERIMPQLLAHQGGKAVGTAAEVHRPGGDQHPHSRHNRDHVAAFTTRSTVVSDTASGLDLGKSLVSDTGPTRSIQRDIRRSAVSPEGGA